MARILVVLVVLAMMAVSSHAQILPKAIYFNRTRISRYFDGVLDDGTPGHTEADLAKPGKSLAVVYSITTIPAPTAALQATAGPAGCTGKLYQTATYATVDTANWENTWANFELSLQLDECKGSPGRPYKKGAIFAAGLGTAIAAASSYPKGVYGGFDQFSFKKLSAGYLERTTGDGVSPALYAITFK